MTQFTEADYRRAWNLSPVSDHDTIHTIECRKCGAQQHDPCVYTLTPGAHAYAAHIERVGTPTIRVHTERRQDARALIARRQSVEKRAKEVVALKRRPPDVQNRIELFSIKTQWERDEQRKLVWWLSRYVDILL